jgi:hypothetical protein
MPEKPHETSQRRPAQAVNLGFYKVKSEDLTPRHGQLIKEPCKHCREADQSARTRDSSISHPDASRPVPPLFAGASLSEGDSLNSNISETNNHTNCK